jgi:hypothetical protein
MKFTNLKWRNYIYQNEETFPSIEVKNDSIFTAFPNEWNIELEIKDQYLTSLYKTKINGIKLEPYKDTTLTAKVGFTHSITGELRLTAKLNYIYDVDLTNNEDSHDFSVIYRPDIAESILKYRIPKFFPDISDVWAFMPEDPLSPGDSLQSYNKNELSLSIDSYKYFSWIDYGKFSRYGHPGKFVFIDAVDSTKIDTYDTNYWPVINGIDYLPGFNNKLLSEDLIYGTIPEPDSVDDSNTVTEQTTSQVTGDSICAILVSGTGEDSSEQAAFNFDLELMENNLTKEKLGPRLPPSSIRKMPNASTEEIIALLKSMKGKYKEIYFYYSGHGSEGSANTRDGWLFYFELAAELYATGAKDLHVILDTCNSGSAISNFQGYTDLKNHNLTLITSCSEDTLAYTRYLYTLATGDTIRVGTYTWFFMLCWGEPEAEQDGIEGISLKEAFDWVKIQNPSLYSGAINERMNPQLFIHRAVDTYVDRPEGTQLKPHGFHLYQNYPNPFNPVTTISFSLPVTQFVILKVYSLLGREVEVLIDGKKMYGNYKINYSAAHLSSGIYFYELRCSDYFHRKKMIITK